MGKDFWFVFLPISGSHIDAEIKQYFNVLYF